MKTIADAKRANKAYAKKTDRAYWFAPDAMRFFNSRIHGTSLIGGRYFVTSERMDNNFPWKWTVLEIDESGRVEIVGDFQGYSSLDAAKSAAKALAKKG